MLYELLLTLFIIIAILLVLIIMIQQGKGSMGMGSLGGSTQMLFGGSGGQDLFQKITWVLGSLFMILSFTLTIMRARSEGASQYLSTRTPMTHKTSPVKSSAAVPQPKETAAKKNSEEKKVNGIQ